MTKLRCRYCGGGFGHRLNHRKRVYCCTAHRNAYYALARVSKR